MPILSRWVAVAVYWWRLYFALRVCHDGAWICTPGFALGWFHGYRSMWSNCREWGWRFSAIPVLSLGPDGRLPYRYNVDWTRKEFAK